MVQSKGEERRGECKNLKFNINSSRQPDVGGKVEVQCALTKQRSRYLRKRVACSPTGICVNLKIAEGGTYCVHVHAVLCRWKGRVCMCVCAC